MNTPADVFEIRDGLWGARDELMGGALVRHVLETDPDVPF
jgi:hypothetical protein